MVVYTTIRISKETKLKLDKFLNYKLKTYDEILKAILKQIPLENQNETTPQTQDINNS